jgi:hypothetical protein
VTRSASGHISELSPAFKKLADSETSVSEIKEFSLFDSTDDPFGSVTINFRKEIFI